MWSSAQHSWWRKDTVILIVLLEFAQSGTANLVDSQGIKNKGIKRITVILRIRNAEDTEEMSLQRGQEVRLQEVPMREKEPRERQAVPREEEERGGTAWADERANDGPVGPKQATGRGEHNPERAVEPAEMHPGI